MHIVPLWNRHSCDKCLGRLSQGWHIYALMKREQFVESDAGLTIVVLFRGMLAAVIFLTTPLAAIAEPTDPALLEDARSFIQSYATDLQIGNRNAIVDRYDARGAYFVGQGNKRLLTLEQIRKMYRTSWQPPTSFAWKDISYEVIGRDAVVVIGGFDWGGLSTGVIHFSYSALLIRSDGSLKIRLEDESPLPSQRAGGGR